MGGLPASRGEKAGPQEAPGTLEEGREGQFPLPRQFSSSAVPGSSGEARPGVGGAGTHDLSRSVSRGLGPAPQPGGPRRVPRRPPRRCGGQPRLTTAAQGHV